MVLRVQFGGKLHFFLDNKPEFEPHHPHPPSDVPTNIDYYII